MANSTGEGKGLSAEQCFTCEGEQGLPPTHVVRICAACAGEDRAPEQPADSALRLKLERLITGLLDNDGCYSCRNTVQVTGSTVPNMVPHVQRLLCAEHEAKRKFADELSTLLTEDSSQVGKKEGK